MNEAATLTTGRKAEAIRSARRTLELRPMGRDPFDHLIRVRDLAETYAMLVRFGGAAS